MKQKALWEARLEKRLAYLKENGSDEKKIERDVIVRQCRAEIRKAQGRLDALAAHEKRTAALAAKKEAQLALPKEEPVKAKQKAQEPPPAEAKPKKTKKKEGEAKPKA